MSVETKSVASHLACEASITKLGGFLRKLKTARGEPVLVDCLTLWLSNVMHAGLDIASETESLRDALDRVHGPVVCVSNEVGLGVVPATKLGREFRDAAGRLNQFIAAQADRVEFIAAGLPLTLKNETS